MQRPLIYQDAAPSPSKAKVTPLTSPSRVHFVDVDKLNFQSLVVNPKDFEFLRCVLVLLELGYADPTLVNMESKTPLHYSSNLPFFLILPLLKRGGLCEIIKQYVINSMT